MPRVPSAPAVTGALPTNQVAVLRRNQACHRCRKRKLKCDAIRPHCTTCIRSKAAKTGSGEDCSNVECTYDDPLDQPVPSPSGPKAKVRALELRIRELETQLKEKEKEQEGVTLQPPPVPTHPRHPSPPQCHNFDAPDNQYNPNLYRSSVSSMSSTSPAGTPPSMPMMYGQSAEAYPPYNPSFHTSTSSLTPDYTTYSPENELLWSSWPEFLPPPPVLRHLVEVFFASVPLASRILHKPTFFASLLLPPKSPQFPSLALLHAICSLASLFTAIPTDIPPHLAMGEWGDRPHWKGNKNQSFADFHAKASKRGQEEAEETGQRLFESVQAAVILAWYFLAQASWIEVWSLAGKACRFAVPLGINIAENNITLGPSCVVLSLLPPPASPIEAEMRINTWWCAYAVERVVTSCTTWAMVIEDDDITQVLPCNFDAYEAGTASLLHGRQNIRTESLMSAHSMQADSFALYIKSTILISWVKCFNVRFRNKHPVFKTPFPQTTAAFKKLDNYISTFRESFPPQYRDPLGGVGQEGRVSPDPILYSAHMMPHVAMITLHDPYAIINSPICRSAAKMMEAAKCILELTYPMLATSFDFALLEHTVSLAWVLAAKTFAKFMKARAEAGEHAEAAELRAGIEVIKFAFSRMGDKITAGAYLGSVCEQLIQPTASPMKPHFSPSDYFAAAASQQSYASVMEVTDWNDSMFMSSRAGGEPRWNIPQETFARRVPSPPGHESPPGVGMGAAGVRMSPPTRSSSGGSNGIPTPLQGPVPHAGPSPPLLPQHPAQMRPLQQVPTSSPTQQSPQPLSPDPLYTTSILGSRPAPSPMPPMGPRILVDEATGSTYLNSPFGRFPLRN